MYAQTHRHAYSKYKLSLKLHTLYTVDSLQLTTTIHCYIQIYMAVLTASME